MFLGKIVIHSWKNRLRSVSKTGFMVSAFLTAVVTLFFTLPLFALAWWFPELVSNIAPGRNSLDVLNESVPYGLAASLAIQVGAGQNISFNIKPYLTLPVSVSKISNTLILSHLLKYKSFIVFLTVFILWITTVISHTSVYASLFWIVGMVFSLFSVSLGSTLINLLVESRARIILAALGVMGGIVFVLDPPFLETAGYSSGRIFGLLAEGDPSPLVGIVCVWFLCALRVRQLIIRRIKSILSDGRGEAKRNPGIVGQLMRDRGTLQSNVVRRVFLFIWVEVSLIVRNKRPRQVYLMYAVYLFLLCVNIYTVDVSSLPKFVLLAHAFLFTTGPGFMYASFGKSWHSVHNDALSSRGVANRDVEIAQFLTASGLNILFLLPLLPFLMHLKFNILVIISFFIYNVGVSIPVCLFASFWRTKTLKINESAFFNLQGFETKPFLASAVLIVPAAAAPLILSVYISISTLFSICLIAGVMGIAFLLNRSEIHALTK